MSTNKQWIVVARILREAVDLLPSIGPISSNGIPFAPGILEGTMQEVEDFLEYDEYELAWESLAVVGTREGAGAEFWAKMAQASATMNL